MSDWLKVGGKIRIAVLYPGSELLPAFSTLCRSRLALQIRASLVEIKRQHAAEYDVVGHIAPILGQ